MTGKIFIDEQDFSEIGRFDETSDIFGYKEFGDRLSNLLESFKDSSGVFLLDGDWGSGKSFFVRQLSASLRTKGASVILFDAFASDHVEDGFIALSAALYAKAKSELGPKSTTLSIFRESAKTAAALLLPIAARLTFKSLSAGIVNLDEIKELYGEHSDTLDTVVNDGGNITEQVISQKIEQLSERESIMKAFGCALNKLAENISEKSQGNGIKFPLIIIVDELDRCRPNFALDLIEKIKHFFYVNNVCFILVANVDQLEASVSGIYGENFKARTYLEKFFQYKILLPERQRLSDSKSEIYLKHLVSKQKVAFQSPDETWSITQFILVLVEKYGLQLRQIERIVTNLALVNRATNRQYLTISPIVAGLCVMRIVDPIAYDLARKGKVDWETVENFLTAGESRKHSIDLEKIIGEWEAVWWKFVGGGVLTEDIIARKRAELMRYRVEDPKDIVVAMCRYIDELAQN